MLWELNRNRSYEHKFKLMDKNIHNFTRRFFPSGPTALLSLVCGDYNDLSYIENTR